jgi:hypothetical protein
MSINKQRIQQIKGPTNKRAQRGELIDRRSDKHAYRQTNKQINRLTDKHRQTKTKTNETKTRSKMKRFSLYEKNI